MVLGPIHLFSKATQIVIDAMKKACVRRLICVTGFGAGDSRAKLGPLQAMFFELLLGRAYEDKDAQETLVKRSGLDWIIVRPVLLTNGPNTGRYKVLDHPKDWRSGTISRADVADFLLKQVQVFLLSWKNSRVDQLEQLHGSGRRGSPGVRQRRLPIKEARLSRAT